MAVVAVGDFDPAAMERQIRAHFGALTNPPNERPRPKYDVPDHAGTSYAIASDPEARTTSVSVYHLEPARDQSTVGAYRRQIVEGLYSAMLNARLGEIAQKPNAPFLGASVGQGSLVRTADATTLSAVVPDGGAVAGLDAIFTESERVARFGFTQTELDRIKADVARSLERAVAQRDDEDSADLAAEYIRNFSTGEPIPGIVYENALYQRFLPGITLADVNALAKTWAPDGDRVVLVSAPEKSGVTMPTEAQLSAVMTGVANKTLTAYTDTVTSQPLPRRARSSRRRPSRSTG
jgi:zinc protease